jgi:hypothetical protein
VLGIVGAYGIRCGKWKFGIAINTFVPAFGIIRHSFKEFRGIVPCAIVNIGRGHGYPKRYDSIPCISSLKARKGVSLMKSVSVLRSSRLMSRVAKTSNPKIFMQAAPKSKTSRNMRGHETRLNNLNPIYCRPKIDPISSSPQWSQKLKVIYQSQPFAWTV